MTSENDKVLELVRFFSVIKHPISAKKIWETLSPSERPASFVSLLEILFGLETKQKITHFNNFYLALPAGDNPLENYHQKEFLLESKWHKLVKKNAPFDFVPFLDFAVVGGSMVMENVHENSDFDVTVGCRGGRIFTVRAFLSIFFLIIGLKRSKNKTGPAASDKFCFNHFVTQKSYCLSNSNHPYWIILYRRLVPIYGDNQKIIEFFKTNSRWSGRSLVLFDKKYYPKRNNPVRLILEFILSGPIGNLAESFFKKIQINSLQETKNKLNPADSRFIINDSELELHLSNKTIESISKRLAQYEE